MKEVFEVHVEATFSAAHRLREYGTKCENLHGHNWTVVAVVRSPRLDGRGVCVDFRDLRTALADVLEELDHNDLNAIAYFKKNNPSAEHIARYIYGNLSKKIKAKGVKLARIKVAESRGCWAVYSR